MLSHSRFAAAHETAFENSPEQNDVRKAIVAAFGTTRLVNTATAAAVPSM
jgi:hypothetical protein